MANRSSHRWRVLSLNSVTLILAMCLVLSVSSCSDNDAPTPPVHRLDGNTMGTSWSVQLRGSDADRQVVEQAILAELDRINQLMSTWDPESQLSQFNGSESAEPVALHVDTLSVLDAAQRISWLTKGRYDITLSPVIKLWGFGSEPSLQSPSAKELNNALSTTGYRQLVRSGNTVRKRHPELSVDVSSLAKGFAVDKIGEVLESHGVFHYLAEIGGELRARGSGSPGMPWRVGIEQPDATIEAGLQLQDASVASSGTYRNYREENGKRLSHIIDGLTGMPIDHALLAVSVVHESTMLADAWATALLVVGDELAIEIIEQQALSAQLTIRVNDGFTVYRSPAFSSLLVESL